MTWLVGLLRFGLFGDAVPADLPSDEGEWRSLFELSRSQAVTALLYDAIVLLPKEKRPPRSVLFHFATLKPFSSTFRPLLPCHLRQVDVQPILSVQLEGRHWQPIQATQITGPSGFNFSFPNT